MPTPLTLMSDDALLRELLELGYQADSPQTDEDRLQLRTALRRLRSRAQ